MSASQRSFLVIDHARLPAYSAEERAAWLWFTDEEFEEQIAREQEEADRGPPTVDERH